MTWIDKLKEVATETYTRLGACRITKKDIETLVNVKWTMMVEAGKREQGFTKEDALIDVLELLDCNGQYFDLSKEEYNELKRDVFDVSNHKSMAKKDGKYLHNVR